MIPLTLYENAVIKSSLKIPRILLQRVDNSTTLQIPHKSHHFYISHFAFSRLKTWLLTQIFKLSPASRKKERSFFPSCKDFSPVSLESFCDVFLHRRTADVPLRLLLLRIVDAKIAKEKLHNLIKYPL